MPLRGEHKREYQRAYMAKRRGTRLGFAKVSPQRGGESERGVRPVLDPVVSESDRKEQMRNTGARYKRKFSPPTIYGMNARHMEQYMAYINSKGLTLEEFAHPRDGRLSYRFVHLDGTPWLRPAAGHNVE